MCLWSKALPKVSWRISTPMGRSCKGEVMMKRLFALLALPLMLAACEKGPNEEPNQSMEPVVFYAAFEEAAPETRTFVDTNFSLHWHADDRLTIFHGVTEPLQFSFTGETGAKSGTFRNTGGIFYAPDPDAPHNIAVYPYAASHQLDAANHQVVLEMPAVQTYAENAFGRGANTMVAITSGVSDLALYFKNVGTYLNVRLWGENQCVKRITLTATAGEPLSGLAMVTPTYGGEPTCEMLPMASSPTVTLECAEPVLVNTTQENPVSFWIVLPPVAMTSGFTATVEDAAGQTQCFEITKSVNFKRNTYNTLTRELAIQPLPQSPALNEIWYTSTDGEVVTPNDATVFGSTLLGNTYANGRGVMTFEGNVTKAGAKAFMNCTTLASIHLPEKATIVSSQSFQGCSNLTEVILPEKLAVLSTYAFYECTSLKEITIPNITSVSAQAFQGCTSLEKVTLSPRTKTLGNKVFYQCSALKEIALPATVASIGTHAFYQCKSLEAMVLPDAIQTIGERAFYQCSALKSLNLPASLVTLGTYAFYECAALEEAIIPGGVTAIADRTFYGCKMLRRLELPEGLLTIGKGAFGNGSMLEKRNMSLTEVVIPSTVTSIADAAFGYCNALKDITLKPTTPPDFGDGVFGGCSSERAFYVPMASVTAYKVALGVNADGQYVQGVEGL